MFIYICQAPPCFQKLNNWNSKKVYLVVCGCLLVVCGGLWLSAGGLWSFAGGLWLFAGGLRLLVVVCWRFVVVACFNNHDQGDIYFSCIASHFYAG